MATQPPRVVRAVVAAALALAGVNATGGNWSRPMEIAVLASGEAVVFLADGRLVAFDTREEQPRWREVYRVGDLSLQAADVEMAVLNGEPTAVAVLSRTARQSFLLRVGLNSGASSLVPTLMGIGPVGSLALRPGTSELVLTSASDRSLYRMDVADRSPEPKFLFSLPQRMRPGVVAMRAARPEILLSDVDSDVLYLARYPDGARTRLRVVDGLIRSIALDPSDRFAYVAEGRHGSVWRIDLANASAGPREVLRRGTVLVSGEARSIVRDPVDLAVGGDGRLWIVDEAGAALFVLKPDGGTLRKVFQW